MQLESSASNRKYWKLSVFSQCDQQCCRKGEWMWIVCFLSIKAIERFESRRLNEYKNIEIYQMSTVSKYDVTFDSWLLWQTCRTCWTQLSAPLTLILNLGGNTNSFPRFHCANADSPEVLFLTKRRIAWLWGVCYLIIQLRMRLHVKTHNQMCLAAAHGLTVVISVDSS